MSVTLIIIIKVVLLLMSIAYFTIAERKVMAAIQRRKGPNVVGFYGLLQPLADGLKLFVKKMVIPTRANKVIFLFAPIIVLTLSLLNWSLIPFYIEEEIMTNKLMVELAEITYKTKEVNTVCVATSSVSTIEYPITLLLLISSLNVYGIIISGWSSNSKYAFLGCLRSSAQMISYEVSIGLVLLPVIILSKHVNLTQIVQHEHTTGWYMLPLFPCLIIFFISMLAETNRTPFDLPEAEAELVAGYNVEYSSIIFAMFFLGEYSNMILMSSLVVIFFFGGWIFPSFGYVLAFKCLSIICFSIKMTFFCFLFILVRATLPRYKYNQLMAIGWKTILPLILAFLIYVASYMEYLV